MESEVTLEQLKKDYAELEEKYNEMSAKAHSAVEQLTNIVMEIAKADFSDFTKLVTWANTILKKMKELYGERPGGIEETGVERASGIITSERKIILPN